MPIITGCCCFRTLERGSRASGLFTMVISIINIVIDIAALVRMHYMANNAEPQQQWLYLPPGIIPLIYIELFVSVGTFALGILLIIGINYQHDGQRFVFAWLFGMIADRFYDVFLGVYILAWTGGHRFTEIIYILPESIVVAIYWLLNSFILIAAIICVVSYWQELLDDLYGKERRIKYFSKMSNIRNAAMSSAVTPFRSQYGSRSTLMLSQGSLNPAYVHKY
jgi:hypothetical protein